MNHWEEERPSPGARLLPPALLIVGVLLAAWTVPSLLRLADHERVERVADEAAERLSKSTVLLEYNGALRDIAAATEPSVVHVSVAAEVRGRLGMREYTQSGSGWIWDEEGHIVTNAHVVDGASALEVQLNDGSLRQARLLGMDLRTDIAVLKVDKDGLRQAERSQDLPQQGDLVFAFGSPFEFRFSMSSGIVSGIGRSAGLAEVEYENFIQVDAAVNPGNSGGPLVDVRGKVIGMNTAIATGRGSTIGAGQFAGIGLAIPMRIVENVVGQIIEHGAVAKGFLGVGVRDVSASLPMSRMRDAPPILAKVARNYRGEGALVTVVNEGSPAQRAGLRVGDVIVGVGGQRIAQSEEVLSQIGTSRPGTTLPIDIWRADLNSDSGERVQMVAELGTLDPTVAFVDLMRRLHAAGLDDLSDATGPTRGVRVGKVEEGSPVAEHMSSGSIITGCEGQSVSSVDDLLVRISRSPTTRLRLAGPPAVNLTVVLPNGSRREVEVPLSIFRVNP
jgi:S1-C subfamily serine protease